MCSLSIVTTWQSCAFILTTRCRATASDIVSHESCKHGIVQSIWICHGVAGLSYPFQNHKKFHCTIPVHGPGAHLSQPQKMTTSISRRWQPADSSAASVASRMASISFHFPGVAQGRSSSCMVLHGSLRDNFKLRMQDTGCSICRTLFRHCGIGRLYCTRDKESFCLSASVWDTSND